MSSFQYAFGRMRNEHGLRCSRRKWPKERSVLVGTCMGDRVCLCMDDGESIWPWVPQQEDLFGRDWFICDG